MSTKHMDYWNHVLWSDEMKINLFGSDGFKHVWRRQGEILQQSMISSLQKLGCRAVFQHDNDPQTHIQDDHCFTEEA